ncbi:hypothetical protein [Halalkalibacter alkalisediminis]|uniref:Uncharacterized protein n=1 Tax=Halalkalibacter alkalisediminis TaxID=935616 RepID=A0ABV6NJ26_9BACI|nr:hypothetical protein [Halalkalibacter alkalisediminis]
MTKKPYEGGSLFTIRFPNDTSKIVLDTLNDLKEEYGRGFTSKIIDIWEHTFLEGKQEEVKSNYIHLKMPEFLTEDQRKTLESKEFQDTLSSLAYFLLTKTITPTLQHAPIFYGAVPQEPMQQPVLNETPIIKNEEAATVDNSQEEEEISEAAMSFAAKNLFDDDDD